MQLLTSWKESFKLFYPLSNFKLFGLSVARALQVAVPLFLKMFWWAVGLIILVGYFSVNFSMVLMSFVTFLLYLLVRPSVARKDSAYLKSYLHYIWGIFLSLFVFVLVFLACMIPVLLRNNLTVSPREMSVAFLVGFVFAAFSPLWIFFFYDSRGTFKDVVVSWKRAFWMVLYSLPAFLLITLTTSLLGLSLQLFPTEVSFGLLFCLKSLASLVVNMLVVAISSVFYINRLHQQPELYFPAPQKKE